MKRLGTLRIAPKLMSAVIFLILVSAVITAMTFHSLGKIGAAIRMAAQSTERLQNSGHATANLLTYVRNVEAHG